MNNIPISKPFMNEKEWEALKDTILSGWITQGPKVQEFEKKFGECVESKYSIATTSCTTALHLAMMGVGIGEGDYVIVPSFTWIATANVVEYCKATPIFCDSDIDTYNISSKLIEEKIKECLKKGIKPKAVIPVHLFGLCSDMDEIMNLAKKYELKVIEDAACAVGAKYKEKSAGIIGDVGCFSFHPRKIISTGEGGMCITNDLKVAEVMSCLRNHGASISEENRHLSSKPYMLPDFNELGYNYRMTDIQGALGVIQLERLKTLLEERKKWAKVYSGELSNIEWLKTPYVPEGSEHSWQSYVCRVDEKLLGKSRNHIMEYLHSKGISTRPGTHAVHTLGYYKNKYNIGEEEFSNAAELYKTTMSIPLHNMMNDADYEYIISVLKEI